jgi:signal transduction histidine kinase
VPVEDRPTPEETRPPLTWASHAWRYALCLVISGLAWSEVVTIEWRDHRTLFWLELSAGVLSYVLVHFRRRAPLLVAVVIAALTTVSSVAGGPATLAAVSLATARRPGQIVLVGIAGLTAAMGYSVLAPSMVSSSLGVTFGVNLVFIVGILGWGMYLGSRRELLWTLRRRAQRAEDERDLRVAQARVTERTRIAREMHDVLAHRITQVSMQAGALGFRDDLAADRLREGLAHIQNQANEALHELRGILGVLREDGTGQPAAQPQPTYGDVARLVAEARASGSNVQLDDQVDQEGQPVPDAVGRTVYRIVQEGLTNARKHAPGALVSINLTGGPERGIAVELRNPLGFNPFPTATSAPGAGLGMVGLRERTELRGGRLHHGLDRGDFVLRAWIPWAT